MDTTQPKKEYKNIRQLSVSLLLVIPAIFFWCVVLLVLLALFDTFYTDTTECSVARIPIQGILTTTDNGLGDLLGFGAITSADSIIQDIEDAEKDDSIRAIVVDVDSPGGTPVAADEIMTALRKATKPTVAVVRDRGTSAAYWAAVGTDYIIVSPVSDVGSIGVTMSYLEFANATDIAGSRWIDISSGEFKDAGNPERELSEEEQAYFQGQVDTVHEYMVDRIAESRTTMSREDVASLADGRAYLGEEAVTLGLVDGLGDFETAVEYLTSVLPQQDTALELCDVKGSSFEDIF
jgi:protease-4